MSLALRRPLWPSIAPVVPAIGLALAVLAVMFSAEISAAVRVWNSSTAYGHCWLVLPIVGWLLYERRFQAAAVPSQPVWWPALLALPLAMLWIAADLLGIMEGRQLALIGMVEAAILAALGPRQWWSLSAALLYLVFLVPFGAFLTTPLQDFTAGFVAHGLDLLGIPNRVTQFQIEIPEGNFYVAEACAGLRFLIASIAFGALYAVTIFRTPQRRAAFIVISCIVPVIANGFRGLGIVLLGHVLGSAEAAATDHVLYGWIFFTIVIVALAVAGLPFRQDVALARVAPALPVPGMSRRAMLAVCPVMVLAAIGPGVSHALDARAQAGGVARQVLITPPDCALTEVVAAGPLVTQRFRCGQSSLVAHTQLLPRQANPSAVVGAATGWANTMVPGVNVDNRLLTTGGAPPVTWHLVIDEDSPRAAAALLFLHGRPVLGGVRDRLHLAADLLDGSTDAPVAIAVAITAGDADPTDVLQNFLTAQTGLQARIAALSSPQK